MNKNLYLNKILPCIILIYFQDIMVMIEVAIMVETTLMEAMVTIAMLEMIGGKMLILPPKT